MTARTRVQPRPLLSFLGLAGATLIALPLATGWPQDGAESLQDPESAPAGESLYLRHCSVCHGDEGRGDGQAAYLLQPAPRNFASGRFRLVSTANGVPTHADLIETLRRGMPGSAMPPWEWLSEEDLWNLADHVRTLAVRGKAADLVAWAIEEDDELDPGEAREIAESQMKHGPPVDLGAPIAVDAVTLHEGQRLYAKLCASCHGDDGTGEVPIALQNEDGSPTAARDFTAGIFKGPPTQEAIAARILAGLPGSPMPRTPLEDPREARLLAAYVQSLVRPGADERVVQRRRRMTVRRVASMPLGPDDEAWANARGSWFALMPLWWRNDRVEGVVVRAVHDGRSIAFRLSWRDATKSDDVLGADSFGDCVAIELSTQRDPPLFAMGSKGEPVDIAFWRAAWELDLAGVRDVEARHPAMSVDRFLPQLTELRERTLTARQARNGQSSDTRKAPSEDLVAQGFGTVGPRGDVAKRWSASGRWRDGYWDVVLTRPLDTPSGAEVALAPGAHAFTAFAVWDGAAGDRNGQKSVSVWHRLEIER